MTYYLYMKQDADGCDYTIGCGRRAIKLRASTLEGALEECEEYFDPDEHCYGWDGYELEEALVFEMVADAMPILNRMKEEKAKKDREREQKRKEAIEKAEYERLKKKFG